MVAVSENELPTAVPEPVVTVAVTQGTSNPSSDDGEGLSGGGALHANSSSYVQSQVYKFKVGAWGLSTNGTEYTYRATSKESGLAAILAGACDTWCSG